MTSHVHHVTTGNGHMTSSADRVTTDNGHVTSAANHVTTDSGHVTSIQEEQGTQSPLEQEYIVRSAAVSYNYFVTSSSILLSCILVVLIL